MSIIENTRIYNYAKSKPESAKTGLSDKSSLIKRFQDFRKKATARLRKQISK